MEPLLKMVNQGPSRKRMTAKDRLLMDPWEKWKIYNKFPWKFVIHFSIVLLVTIQILLTAAQYTSYSRDNFDLFTKLFYPDNGPDDILSINDTLNSIRESVKRYYEYPNYSVDRYLHIFENGSITPVKMVVKRYKHSFFNETTGEFAYQNFPKYHQTETDIYWITLKPTFPMNESVEDLREWFYSLISIQLEFTWVSLDSGGVFGPVPFYWDITVLYGLDSGGGKADYTIRASKRMLSNSAANGRSALQAFFWLDLGVFLLSIWSLWLCIWGLLANWRFYNKTRNAYISRIQGRLTAAGEPSGVSWSAVPLSVKVQFYNLWHVTCGVGNFLLIIEAAVNLAASHGYPAAEFHHVVFGIGSFIACINILRYLEYYERFYTLIVTVRLSLGRVVSFLLSSFPIFFAYALLGIVCFSQYTSMFINLDMSVVTLFCLLNGDSILQAIETLSAQYPYKWITRVFVYSYVVFFICTVLNIFIFLIEDSFHAAKAISQKENLSGSQSSVDNGSTITLAQLLAIVESVEEELEEEDVSLVNPEQEEDAAANPNSLTQFASLIQKQMQKSAADAVELASAKDSEIAAIVAEVQKAMRDELSTHMMALAAAHERQLRALEKRLAAVQRKQQSTDV